MDGCSVRPGAPARVQQVVSTVYGWACERLYHELAGTYDGVAAAVSLGRWSGWRQAALDYVVGDRILELGFGTGHLLQEGQRRGWHMTGMDASPEMIAIARRKLTRSPAPSILVQGRAQDLPFAGGSIDTVVCTFPAPFVLEPQTLRECARVLRPDSAGNRSGRIVILGLWVDLDAGDWKYVLPVFYGPPPASLLSELARNLEAAGFRARIAEVADDPFRIGVVTADLNAALQ